MLYKLIKRVKFLVISMLIFLTAAGCASNIEKEKIGNEQKVIVDNNQLAGTSIEERREQTEKQNEEYQKLQENYQWGYRYYSPDRKNYIRADVYIGEGDYDERRVYLNKSSDQLSQDIMFYTYKSINPSGIWLNNTQVLIGGGFILNIESNAEEIIDFSKILKEGDKIDAYFVNKEKDKIAYVILADTFSRQKVFVYDLPTKTWEHIIDTRYGDTGELNCLIFWDYKGDLYFDSVDRIEKENKLVQTVNIYKYDFQTKTLKPYKENYVLQSVSPDYKYIVIRDILSNDYVCKLINVEKDKEVPIEGLDTDVPWSDDGGSLAYINEGHINFFSLEQREIIKSISLKDFKNSCITYMDYYDGYYVFLTVPVSDDGSIIGDLTIGDLYRIK